MVERILELPWVAAALPYVIGLALVTLVVAPLYLRWALTWGRIGRRP